MTEQADAGARCGFESRTGDRLVVSFQVTLY